MIEKIIAFLQWIQASESLKKWVDRFFSFLILFVSTTLIWTIYKDAIGDCSRYYGCNDLFPWETLTESLIGGFLTVAIVISLIYGAWKKIWSYEYSVMRLLLNTTLPFLVGLILLSLYRDSIIHTYSYGPGWYIYFFGGLYALSPFVNFIRSNTPGEGILKKTLGLYSKYIVSFLIGLVIFTVLFGLSTIFDEMRYMDFAEIVLFLFIVFCVFGLGTWLVLTYAWDEVKPVDDNSSRNIRKGSIWLAAFFLFIWLSPDWKEVIIDGRIEAAQSALQKYGETAEGYKKASSVWGLKWAMKERYLENRLYNKDLYARIFDKSIESDIEDEIDVNKYSAWNSNGTSMLARGENAKVELNFAKHESEIKSDISAMETTVTYEFQNTDTQNQEVIYSIELPSSEAVVTDLRLGLNLELTGALAPRGAAAKVYNDSLRRNTDPALLEQTGPTTYRLRVFPVPSVSDPKTQGRQRVSFRYVTPITSGDDIIAMPKTDILNLKLTKKSEIVIRVMEGTKALYQDSFKTKDIEELVAGKHVSVKLENTLKDSLGYCAINTYEGLDISKLKTGEKNLTKNIVFLDISKSAGKESTTKKRYQELIDAWKNNGAALDIYTFNTLVTSAGYDLSDIDFWGNTDMAAVISYIQKNGIENSNIVIITDDESYEIANTEDKTLDYKKLKSNRISLIQIGDKIRTLKTEVTKSILASEGNVLRLAPKASLDEGIKSIFTPKKTPTSCEPYNGNNTGTLSALEGGRDGRKVYGERSTYTGEVLTIKDQKYARYDGIPPSFLAIYENDVYAGRTNFYEPFLSELKKGSILEGYVDMNAIQLGIPSRIPVGWQTKVDTGWGGPTNGAQILINIPTNTVHWQFIENGKIKEDVVKTYTQEEISSLWKNALYISTIETITLSDQEIQEKIGKTAHIVNQSMSLIALETAQQMRDLERYSNQNDKYDTTYQNFNNTNQGGSPQWNRREIILDDMEMPRAVGDFSINLTSMEPASVSSSRRSSDTLFGMNSKATANSIGSSSDSYSLGGGSIGLLSGGSSSGRGGLLQIVAIIILFPLMAWYVLRKKKPQAAPEKKKEEKKPE